MVAPLIIAAGISAAASVVGGLISQAGNAKSERDQRRMIQAARDEINKIQDPQQKALLFEELQKQGTYTPELEQALMMPDSEMGNVSTDPELRQAQMEALYNLKEIGKDGLNQQDELEIEKAKSSIINQQSQADANIKSDMARRGVNSAGLELVARQQAGQNLSNNMSNFQQATQAEARNRALQAMAQRGALAGSIRGQDFGEDSDKAKAQDAINQFRVQNSQSVQNRNVDRSNQGQIQNLSETQRIADANTAIRNSQTQSNNQMDQQRFENQLTKANAANGILNPALTASSNQAKNNSAMWGGLINGVNTGVATWASSQKKKDEEEEG